MNHLLPISSREQPLSHQLRTAGQQLAAAVVAGDFAALPETKQFEIAELSLSLAAWADHAEDMEAAASDNLPPRREGVLAGVRRIVGRVG